MSGPASAVYAGTVRHRRFEPVSHAFRYPVFMMYLDLDELPGLFDRFPFWSARRPAPAWFRAADFLPGAAGGPAEGVRDLVAAETGRRPRGPIRLLAHLRYFGYGFNPVSFYYVFPEGADAGARPECVVAEITNTPWKERHTYVLPSRPAGAGPARGSRHRFGKAFHVSPFLPMDMEYRWFLGDPGDRLVVHMENLRDGRRVFDATLNLQRRPITARSLYGALLRHPVMTATVITAIHWQALRLRVRGAPFFSHPAKHRAA